MVVKLDIVDIVDDSLIEPCLPCKVGKPSLIVYTAAGKYCVHASVATLVTETPHVIGSHAAARPLPAPGAETPETEGCNLISSSRYPRIARRGGVCCRCQLLSVRSDHHKGDWSSHIPYTCSCMDYFLAMEWHHYKSNPMLLYRLDR